MSAPVILLVEPDNLSAQFLSHTLADYALPRPVQVTTGEEAVLWVSAHACSVCVLSYELPGINGLETFIRIRQRRPDLPVIMVSSARAEEVAVAAFRAGVADYVPTGRDCERVVAHRLQQLAHATPVASPAPPAPDHDIPEALLRPTYQNRLRVIGRQLDLYSYRSVSLFEVGGGFLVRALPARGRVPEALEFADRDFAQLVMAGFAARGEGERARPTSALLPTGYEDFLRALGHRLDARMAEAVTVIELPEFVAVGCVVKAESHVDAVVEPLQWLLRAGETASMLDEAYRRRAKPAARPTSPLARLLGR